MRFIIGLALFFCFLGASMRAQDVSFSAPQKKRSATNVLSVTGHDNQSFYTVEVLSKEQQVLLSHYNLQEMKVQWSKPVSYGSSDNVGYEDIIHLSSGFYLFTSSFDKESEQLRIYCTILDHDSKPLGEPILVHHILSEGLEQSAKFGIEVSPDGEKFLIYFDPTYERKNTEPLSFRCYDQELDMLWEKEILLPYNNHTIQVHQFVVDNDANLYMLSGRKISTDFVKQGKVEAGNHILFFYDPKQHKLKEYDVTLKEKQIANIQMCFDDKLNIIVAGYYSTDYKMNISGTFFYNFAHSGGGVLAASFMPFRPSMYEHYNTDSSKEYLPDYYLKKIIPLTDGSTLLIGEQQYTSEQIIYDQIMNSNRKETRYHFGNILVSKLEANGRHIWNTIVPKEQYAVNTDFTNYSFCSFLNEQGLNLLYNDHKDNPGKYASSAEMIQWSGFANSITTCASINLNGSLTMKALFANKEKGGLLQPQTYSRTTTKLGLFGLMDGAMYSIGTVK